MHHYPFCPIVLDFVSETMGGRCISDFLWVIDSYIPHFLLEKVHVEDLIRTAVWCDVIPYLFNSRRAASATAGPCSSSRDTLRARLRVVFCCQGPLCDEGR